METSPVGDGRSSDPKIETEVTIVMGSLNGVLAVLAAIVGAFSMYKYLGSSDNKLWLVVGILGLLAFLVLGAMFLSGRVNKTEDIHITE